MHAARKLQFKGFLEEDVLRAGRRVHTDSEKKGAARCGEVHAGKKPEPETAW